VSTELELGNYNLVRGTATVNIPLSDTLAFRGSVQRYYHDGFAKQTSFSSSYGKYGLDDADRVPTKGSLLWKPTEEFTAQLTAQYFNADEYGAAQKNVDDPDPNPRHISQDDPNKYKLDFFLTYLDLQYDFGPVTIKSLTSYQRTRNHNQIDVDRRITRPWATTMSSPIGITMSMRSARRSTSPPTGMALSAISLAPFPLSETGSAHSGASGYRCRPRLT
jgi:iron complex outermembrane receptor protein